MIFRFDPFDQLHRAERAQGLLAMDAVHSDDHVDVYFDAPGFERDDIDLTVERNAVTVVGTRRWFAGDDTTLVNERPQGTFRRHIQFGDTVDVDAIEAELANGVLRLTLPVKEGTKARSIEITTGDSSGRRLEATTTG